MEFVRAIYLTSSATYAGLGTTVALVTIPAILGSSDPLPSWRIMYNRAKNISIATILTTTSSGLLLFWQNGDNRFLLSAILSFMVGPYTLLFLTPTNDAIFALANSNSNPNSQSQDGDEDETKIQKSLLSKWATLQWVRTGLGVSAFLIGVHALIIRPQRFYENLNIKLEKIFK